MRYSSDLRNLLLVYASQAISFILPLLSLPIMSKNLDPSDWVKFLAAQSLILIFATIMEYGQNISATRRIANSKDNKSRLEIVESLISSKIFILIVLSLPCLMIVTLGGNISGIGGLLLFAVVVGGAAQGASPLWFFQGINEVGLGVLWDVITRSCFSAISIFSVVFHKSADTSIYILIIGNIISLFIQFYIVYAKLRIRFRVNFSFYSARKIIESDFSLILYRVMAVGYTSALPIIIASIFTPKIAGSIIAADRISKIIPSLFSPVQQVMYGKFVKISDDRKSLKMKVFTTVGIVALISSIMSFVLFNNRYYVVNMMLDENYGSVVNLIKISLFISPFMALNAILIQLWFFVLGNDRIAAILISMNFLISIVWLFSAKSLDKSYYLAGLYLSEVIIFIFLLIKISSRRYEE